MSDYLWTNSNGIGALEKFQNLRFDRRKSPRKAL